LIGARAVVLALFDFAG